MGTEEGASLDFHLLPSTHVLCLSFGRPLLSSLSGLVRILGIVPWWITVEVHPLGTYYGIWKGEQ